MNDDVLEKIQSHLQNHTRGIVAVCGLGGVGKTQFCKQLIARVQCAYMQSDWYLIDSSTKRQQKIEAIFTKHLEWDPNEYGNPHHWYDWYKFKSDLMKLQHDGSLTIDNAWNQQTGDKDLHVEVNLQEDGFILCDGIYMFDPLVQGITELTILLEISSELARVRAENRDSHRSNQQYLEKKEKLAQFYEVPYIDQYRYKADLIINNNDYKNPSIIFSRQG